MPSTYSFMDHQYIVSHEAQENMNLLSYHVPFIIPNIMDIHVRQYAFYQKKEYATLYLLQYNTVQSYTYASSSLVSHI